MHQRRQSSEAESKTSSINSHSSSYSRRRQDSLRRTWSHGLPSLATNTIKMVVATLQLGTPMTDLTEEANDKFDEYDDDDIADIGQQLEAHIPDFVLNKLNDLIDCEDRIAIPTEHKYNNTTLLFLDVSGFTALTEQYSNDVHLGIDQLTRTLNTYFDKLVYEILTHGGDVYKFAGDAILALWTDDKTGPSKALKCALHLQQKCGGSVTDVGVTLRLKIALAYGSIQAFFVGTEEFKHYLLTGDCVKNVNICEQLCEPGDIIITKTIYDKLQSTSFNCEFVPVSDDIDPKNEHIAVKYSPSRKSSIGEEFDTEDHINSDTIVNDRMDLSNQEITNDNNHHNHHYHSNGSGPNDLSHHELNMKIDSLMKSFLLRCVYQRIERKQSLDYLSELRRVTISFINLDISTDQNQNENLCENIHKIFLEIYESTKMMGGVLTKALLFDKGWSFLCVFGLPGYKQGDDTANALKSAHNINSKIRSQCKFVEKCSIGVTTGLTYCGVVGHKARCEYTVIGRKVNMAARLMCNYPNIISCDQETYYNSRLNNRFFQILPDKILKGMNNVGVIWQYGDYQDNLQVQNNQMVKQDKNKTNDIQHENFPLLGRRVELMTVAAQIMLLDEPSNTKNRRRGLAAIIFEGEDKIGRSRLLQFIADSLETSSNNNHLSAVSYYDSTYIPTDSSMNNNATIIPTPNNETGPISSLNNYASDCSTIKKSSIQVISYRCQFEHRFKEFNLLRSLLKHLLQFHNNEKSSYEREQCILRLFDINNANDVHLRRNLFLLNDLLDVRFRGNNIETENIYQKNLSKTYEDYINELLSHILKKLIEIPSNIGESYSPTTIKTTSNTSCTIYSQSRISSGSTSSLSSPTSIPTASKIIFIIDDIHFADETSLKYLLTLGSNPRSLLILSMKPPRNNSNDRSNSDILQSISTDSRVYLRRLPGLELRYLPTLGCQMLSVHRVPSKLVKIFNESCNGIPGFCEQILFDLLQKDKIYIVDNNDSHDQDSNLIEGDSDKLILNTRVKNGIFKTFFTRRKSQVSNEIREKEPIFSRICLLRDPTEHDFNADCQQNFQNYIMCRIDRLSEGESLLVKIAAIIGNTFSRMFLWHLVDPQSKKLINISSCILEMMQRTIIECAFSKQQHTKTRTIKCYCLQNPGGFPSQCRLMAFTHSTIREGISNSLTDSLKRLLIRNAIDFLEKHCTILCLTCGCSRIDSPFLVHEEDGLAKILKNRQQHGFVDIVKMAALKEIDNTIKQLSRITNSPSRLRTAVSSITPMESTTPGKENGSINDNHSTNTHEDNFDTISNFDIISNQTPHIRPPFLPTTSMIEDDNSNEETLDLPSRQSLRRNSSDPNLTLISVYSPNTSPTIKVNVQRSSGSTVPSKSSQIFSLFKLPKRRDSSISTTDTNLLQNIDGSMTVDTQIKHETLVETAQTLKQNKNNRFITFIRFIFCELVPRGSRATVTPAIDNETVTATTTPNHKSTNDSNQTSPIHTTAQIENHPKEHEIPTKRPSHWKKVRKVMLPATPDKVLRAIPSEEELLSQAMFSPDLMVQLSEDLNCLNKQSSLTRTFQILYDQSLFFCTFQSYVQHNHLVRYVYDVKQNEEQNPDLNKFINEFNSYNDLRTCECADYVMTVYIKLTEYHTNLYDIYEKITDDKRDHVRLKQFDRIMYYRIEICQLLLRCNCYHRLLIEIENGKKFLEKFQNDSNNQEDFIYQYRYFILKSIFNFYQATLLQRTRAINDSKQICEQSLDELNKAYQNKIWEKVLVHTISTESSSAKEKRQQYEHSKDIQSKESLLDFYYSVQSSTTSNTEQFILFYEKYRFEHLLCQYSLLQYELSRHQSIESINTLINLQYYTFPLSFSLPCTITLIEYYYCQMDYTQCIKIIDKIIHFWWSYISPREKLEFAKLKCLALIIELKCGSLESAVLSGYFAKRILTGYHENKFLIESCIHLTFALIGEMRISNIELILQHLEYLSEQTMNIDAKLWYYILVLDVAIELGYELLPITVELLDNITKYRKKLPPGPNERSLLLVYSDAILSQIYARLGMLDMSKIHFHQVLHQIKYDQMHLSNVDIRFKRTLLKLVEIQLIHWYHTKENDVAITKNYFLLNYLNKFNNEQFVSWGKARFLIYQAYYDRLINDYRRQEKFPIDNDFNWESNLREAESHGIKLDSEWIKRLRAAWLHPVSEQIASYEKYSICSEQPRRSTTVLTKQPNRRFVRPSVPHNKMSLRSDTIIERTDDEQFQTVDNYFRQKFLDRRSYLTNNDTSQFQLYILPVRV